MGRGQRGTILVEEAGILDRTEWPDEQYIVRLGAPGIAARATAGSFVHVQCGPELPMRRPLSIMRADAGDGWIDVLFKVAGEGMRELSMRKTGDIVSAIGPIGRGFCADPERPLNLLIGGGVGIPPLVFFAEQEIAARAKPAENVAFFGSEIPFPFDLTTSALDIAGCPDEAVATLSLFEEWNIPARLASGAGLGGCFRGFVTELAAAWLSALPDDKRRRVTLFACGPDPMLRAAQRLADEFRLPSQLCLEEYMACGVGG